MASMKDVELASVGSLVRRHSSNILLRQDLSRVSALGSYHTGHKSWQVASGHIITAVIGAGVLGVPHSMAWMGWFGGVAALVVFSLIILWCMRVLADVYEVKGRRHTRYKDAVVSILGSTAAVLLSVLQHATMILVTLGYHIAAAESMAYIAGELCQVTGTPAGQCFNTYWIMAFVFAGLQILMSQLPTLESAWWTSLIGAAMSFGYSAVAIALRASQAYHQQRSVEGRPAVDPTEKTFAVFNALGALGVSYSCAIVLIEIQDTLREPPQAAVSMKKAINFGLVATFIIYMAVSILGYLTLGNNVPGNILLGFRGSPGWVTILGNAMVLIHVVSAYQVFAQPLYATAEDIMIRKLPFIAKLQEWFVRGVYRTMYVVFTTVVASALPFFSAFVGLIGAISYWPTAVFFPIMLHRAVYKPKGLQVWLMHVVNAIMAIVTLMAIAGSIQSIVVSAGSMKPFQGGGSAH